jgi:hypothetical protein
MNKQPKILIIAPHSKCDSEIAQRHCDIRAKEIAENLKKVAENLNYDVKLILSDMLRSIHDYNRKESFNTPWRQQIRNYIEDNFDTPIIIYETHSFPPKGTEFVDGSQMALLAIDEYYSGTKKMHDYLNNTTDIKIHNAINNTRINNLMIETSRYPNIKHHYLLEFNEDSNILSSEDGKSITTSIFLSSLIPKGMNFCKNIYISIILVIVVIRVIILLIYLTTYVYNNYMLGIDYSITDAANGFM